MNILTFLVAFIGSIIGAFFGKYLGKKGENLATKEDVSEITQKIENVRLEYAKQLESTKADLSSQLKTHGFRYEKEYEILSELTALLVDVRDACINLRPWLDFVDPKKTQEQIKQERLNRLYDARKNLYSTIEKKRPFFPDEIYQSILQIDNIASSESASYQCGDPHDKDALEKYWKVAESNKDKILGQAEKAMGIIRDRVIKWESLANFDKGK